MEKPYEFIPFNDVVKREKIIGREFLKPDRYHGKLTLKITALTPLLVATGELDYVNQVLVNGLVTRNGIPVIPGSSLKGLSRAHAEMMSFACNFSKAPYIGQRERSDKLTPSNKKPCSSRSSYNPVDMEACVCCRMYGFVGQQNTVQRGLLEFSEFTLQGDPERFLTTTKIPPLYAPLRSETAMDHYLSDEDYLQKKVYRHGKPEDHTGQSYQVVTEGAIFTGEVSFLNLKQEELALFMLSLGAAEGTRRFQSKLGYAKPAFYGSVQIEIVDVSPYTRPFLHHLQQVTYDDMLTWVEQYGTDDPFLTSQIQQVVSHYQFERDKNREWGLNASGQRGY